MNDFEVPPEGTTNMKEWNRQRREESQGKKRTRFHRPQHDRNAGVGKVRSREITPGKD